MGCDIHLYIECRRDKSQPWTVSPFHSKIEDNGFHLTNEFNDRNYAMFGLMANVRGVHQLFNPRGLPENCSTDLVEIVEYNGNWHNHSWLTDNELEKCISRHSELFKMKGPMRQINSYAELLNKAKKWQADELTEAILLGSKAEPEFRFVFWFDS